ncbi:AraC family transcriptional regulator [Paenibacillus montanisoli]|nr:AraC family transcriptional regulator [Paenibacillus montanisoli]
MKTIVPIKRPLYFYSLLMKITFFITLTVLILSFFLNYNFKNYSIDLLNTSNEKLMNQIFQNALQTHNYVKNYTVTMFNDPDAANLMYGEDVSIVKIMTSLRNLDTSIGSTPYIHSAYVYNGRTETYYSVGPNVSIRKRDSFLDTELVRMLSNPISLHALAPIPRKIPISELDSNRTENVFSYIVPEYFRGTKKVKNALVLNVRMNWIFNTLSTYQETDSLKGNDILILDPQGMVVANSNSGDDLFLKNVSGESFVAPILTSGRKSDVFLADVRDESSVITYVTYDASPWVLVNITPYKYISDSIGKVKRVTLTIGCFMLVICLITAFLLAKNLYAPVRSLRHMVGQLGDRQTAEQDPRSEFDYITETFKSTQHKLTSLEIFRKTNQFTLKQKKLKELLYNQHASEANYDDLSKEHPLAIDPRSGMAVILFKIDNYADFQARYPMRDQTLLKYALLNIIDEIIHPYFRCESLDNSEDEVVTLLNIEAQGTAPDESATYVNRLRELILDIQHVYATYCSISVSAFISRASESVREARGLLEDTIDLSHYRLKYGHCCIVARQEFDGVPRSDFNIHNEYIAKLLEALKKGRLEDSADLYHNLMLSLSGCSYNNIMFALSYLSSNIFNTINLMEKNGTISFALDFVLFDNKIKSLETLEQINTAFNDLMKTIVGRIEQNRDEKSEIVVLNARRYIDAHYLDKSLSANLVADQFKLTPAYLGKLFREHLSQSIAEYISEIRLVKSAELLKESSLNIDEILERVGWENKKHFFTLFKKRYAATPTEFRLKSKTMEI